MRELCTNPGKMRACLACCGRSVNNKLQVCDDCIVVPLGIFTLSGTCAACLSLYGAAADKTLMVHPESIISVSYVGAFVVVGVQSKDNAK